MITVKCVEDYNPYDNSKYLELEKGQVYEVDEISMGASFTYITLKDLPHRSFNSICFEFYEDDKTIDIYRDKRFYPAWKNPQSSF